MSHASYPLTTTDQEPTGSLAVTPAPAALDLPRRTMRVFAYDSLTRDAIVAYLAPEHALSLALDLGARFNLFPAARAAVGSVWRLAPQPRTAADGEVHFGPDVTRVIVRGEVHQGDVLVSALDGPADGVATQFVCYAYLLPLGEDGQA